jgi:hypothetical protein
MITTKPLFSVYINKLTGEIVRGFISRHNVFIFEDATSYTKSGYTLSTMTQLIEDYDLIGLFDDSTKEAQDIDDLINKGQVNYSLTEIK